MTDILREVTIHVTEKHIAAGWRCSDGRCPVALALNDVLKDGMKASLTVAEVTVWQVAGREIFDELELYSFPTPADVARWAINFDREKPTTPVVPFKFVVTLPEKLLRYRLRLRLRLRPRDVPPGFPKPDF